MGVRSRLWIQAPTDEYLSIAYLSQSITIFSLLIQDTLEDNAMKMSTEATRRYGICTQPDLLILSYNAAVRVFHISVIPKRLIISSSLPSLCGEGARGTLRAYLDAAGPP